jgi:hypothetical protein
VLAGSPTQQRYEAGKKFENFLDLISEYLFETPLGWLWRLQNHSCNYVNDASRQIWASAWRALALEILVKNFHRGELIFLTISGWVLHCVVGNFFLHVNFHWARRNLLRSISQ